MLTTYTETRTYTPAEVVPAHTLAEFGENEMQREFASLVKNSGGMITVDGWTVTFSIRSDEAESDVRARLIARLDGIPAITNRALA